MTLLCVVCGVCVCVCVCVVCVGVCVCEFSHGLCDPVNWSESAQSHCFSS